MIPELEKFQLVDIPIRQRKSQCPADRYISDKPSVTSQTELPILVTTNHSTIEKIALSPEEKLLLMQTYLPKIKEVLASLLDLGMCINKSDIRIDISLSHIKKAILLFSREYYLGEYLLPSLEIEIPKERPKPAKKGGEK